MASYFTIVSRLLSCLVSGLIETKFIRNIRKVRYSYESYNFFDEGGLAYPVISSKLRHVCLDSLAGRR